MSYLHFISSFWFLTMWFFHYNSSFYFRSFIYCLQFHLNSFLFPQIDSFFLIKIACKVLTDSFCIFHFVLTNFQFEINFLFLVSILVYGRISMLSRIECDCWLFLCVKILKLRYFLRHREIFKNGFNGEEEKLFNLRT